MRDCKLWLGFPKKSRRSPALGIKSGASEYYKEGNARRAEYRRFKSSLFVHEYESSHVIRA